MAVRTTVDIPEPLHETLRLQAAEAGVSIRSLIVRALEQTYPAPRKGRRVRGPLIQGPRTPGPAFPKDENPHDLVFS